VRALLFFTALLAAATPLRAVPLEGRVLNGTTGQPVANVTAQLIKLQQGMTPVASATTDAQGVFRIETDALSGAPGLIQVEYQGATYSQPLVSPQTLTGGINIQVYEATSDRSIVHVIEHAIFLRPSGGELAVIEQIELDNNSNPPRSYVNREGTYTFTLPGEPPGDLQASIKGAAGMPIPLALGSGSQPGTFVINYPIRPGASQVSLQYTLDYKDPYQFSKTLVQPAEQTHVVTPGEGVRLTGEVLQELGKEPTTGFMAYLVKPGSASANFQVTGEAVLTAAEAQTSESGALTQIADPATQRVWLILSALGLVMLAGYWYLYARSA
jgi:hypothetical protein